MPMRKQLLPQSFMVAAIFAVCLAVLIAGQTPPTSAPALTDAQKIAVLEKQVAELKAAIAQYKTKVAVCDYNASLDEQKATQNELATLAAKEKAALAPAPSAPTGPQAATGPVTAKKQ
jgi:hypothetical protein